VSGHDDEYRWTSALGDGSTCRGAIGGLGTDALLVVAVRTRSGEGGDRAGWHPAGRDAALGGAADPNPPAAPEDDGGS